MGQVLHGSAKTTHAIRGELQRSQASVASLAKRFSINEKTVLKWRKRQSVEDMPMGPKERRSTVLSPREEAAIVALRVQARLPLDDVYIALKDVIPHLTRSSLHRCLQRHGISCLPKADREKPKKFKEYAIGYFHIDIAELRYEGGKGFLFTATPRASAQPIRWDRSFIAIGGIVWSRRLAVRPAGSKGSGVRASSPVSFPTESTAWR